MSYLNGLFKPKPKRVFDKRNYYRYNWTFQMWMHDGMVHELCPKCGRAKDKPNSSCSGWR